MLFGLSGQERTATRSRDVDKELLFWPVVFG